MTSALQKRQCCSAVPAAQRSENCSATSVFACGMLQGWGLEGSGLGLAERSKGAVRVRVGDSDMIFPYRRPSPQPHPDPTQHPVSDPKRTRNGPETDPKQSQTEPNGAETDRNGAEMGLRSTPRLLKFSDVIHSEACQAMAKNSLKDSVDKNAH